MLDSGFGFWIQDLGAEGLPPPLVRSWGCSGGVRTPLLALWGEGGTAEPPQPPTPSLLVFQTPLLDSESSLDYGHSITQVGEEGAGR